MGRRSALQGLYLLLCWVPSGAQTAQPISKLSPVTGRVETGLTIGPGLVVTPTNLARRRLSQENGAKGAGSHEHRRMRRNLLQNVPYQSSGPVPQVSIEFVRTVLRPLSPGNNATRRMLLQSSQPQLTFHSLLQQGALSDAVTGTYIFDSTAQGFLSIATQSGTTFRFLQALLIYPQEQNPTNVPPHIVSRRGFTPTDPTHPTIVKLTTEGATSHVPTLGLRFDYQQYAPGLTPYISLYYTDQVGTFDVDGGLPLPCLTQYFHE